MLRYCIECKEIYGCVKDEKTKKECYRCLKKENCPKNILYPKQDVTGGLCHVCHQEIIWKLHEKNYKKKV